MTAQCVESDRWKLHVQPPFVTFEGRLSVWVDDLRVELHTVPTPAHTTNDVVVWIPERSVLFTGGLAVRRRHAVSADGFRQWFALRIGVAS
jgi:glyoxylase-like metal-dependent hydrolase (beta-lactamase superfamily II)